MCKSVRIGFFSDLRLEYRGPVVNIQTPYEIFIYLEGGISDPNLKAG